MFTCKAKGIVGTVDGRITHQAGPRLDQLHFQTVPQQSNTDFRIFRPRPNKQSWKCHEQGRDALGTKSHGRVSNSENL